MAHTNQKESMKCKENLVQKGHEKHAWGTRKFDTSAIVENIVTYLKDNPPNYQGQANGMLELLLIYKCRVSVPNSQLGLNPLIV